MIHLSVRLPPTDPAANYLAVDRHLEDIDLHLFQYKRANQMPLPLLPARCKSAQLGSVARRTSRTTVLVRLSHAGLELPYRIKRVSARCSVEEEWAEAVMASSHIGHTIWTD